MAKVKRKKEKSKFRIYLEYYLFSLLFKTLELIPISVCMKLSSIFMPLLFLLDRRHAQRTIRNVMYAGVIKDSAQARRFAIANFREFGKLLVEIVKMKQLYSQEKMHMAAPENTMKIISPELNPGNRQIILAVAHYGNWEVAGTAFAEYQQTPMVSLMRPFANPLIGEKILAHRGGNMHELIDKNLGLRPILRAINSGKTVTMLVDQHAMSGEGIEVEFFGHPARMHMTPALLHLKTGIPIVPEITRRRNDNFEFDFLFGEPIIYKPTGNKERDIYMVTQQIAHALEELILRDPVQWLWAPRHWLSLDRKNADAYQNWKAPEFPEEPAPEAE